MSNKSMTVYEKTKVIMRSDAVVEEFAKVLGTDSTAKSYISSALMAVANSEQLKKCSTKSIIKSAIQAATMQLSCEPTTGQAWLVPYKGQATFQIGYKGLKQLAMRTHQYRYINEDVIYEGEELVQNRITGTCELRGGKKSNTIIGYFSYFELKDGLNKTL